MDGLDLSAIDQIDQDVFNGSPERENSDEEADLPTPDCIGLDSAVQDEEQARIKLSNELQSARKTKTRSEEERELEIKLLKPSSIRRQILEQSLKDGHNKSDELKEDCNSNLSNNQPSTSSCKPSHVMNIVEKAGMKGIDKEKINEIIHEASKGSLFYKKQAQRQEEIHRSIERMLNKVKDATTTQVANAQLSCDRMLEDLKKQRIFNRVIVHFDLDMFFAAVEIRDNPELANKPVAVGGNSMISTSNYIARKFGVRAAMPGFIARKLCPELLLIKPNGSKYRQASSEVFSILEQYDPELAGMSLDEAYLDLTDFIRNTLERDGYELQEFYDGTLPKIWWARANEVVHEIRDAIFNKTKLTCSAGIACNTLLSKISTDMNKPDGQFMVEGYPQEVQEFIEKTPVEKVSGIGKVSGQLLNALEIKTCGDIMDKRHYLPLVFYEVNVKFYLRVALGDGSTCIKSDEQRKSKSVERTFTSIKDSLMLLDKLDSICEELCTKYLKPYRIRGRTITIKLKRNTFTTTTKSYSLLVPTNDKQVIYSTAKNLLLAEIANEPPEISYRLLGVKVSNLADEGITANQMTIDAMLRNQELTKQTTSDGKTPTDHPCEQPFATCDTMQSPSPSLTDELDLQTQLMIQEDLSKIPSSMQQESGPDDESCSKKVGVKRKEPATKRIEDFFPTQPSKHQKSTQSNSIPFSTQPTNQSYEDFLTQDSQVRVSFYQKFIDANSRTFSQAPKTEPLQCPYCYHGFLKFESLETHVPVCSKNKSKNC